MEDPDASAEGPRKVWGGFMLLCLVVELVIVRHVLSHVEVNGWVVLNTVALFATMALSTALHELGHALVGLLVGFRVRLVRVGVGRTVWERRVFGCVVRLRVMPLSGLTLARMLEPRLLRWKYAAFVLGGIASHVVLLTATAALLPRGHFRNVLDGSGSFCNRRAFLEIWIWVQLVMAIGNLLPLPSAVKLGTRTIWRDGVEVFRALFARDTRLLHLALSGRLLEFGDALRQRRSADAVAHARRAITFAPGRPGLHFGLGIALDQAGDPVAALHELKRERDAERARPKPSISALLLFGSLAWVAYRTADHTELPEADEAATTALRIDADDALALRARGATLYAMGRVDDAHPFLLRAVERSKTAGDRNHALACLAMCESARTYQAMTR